MHISRKNCFDSKQHKTTSHHTKSDEHEDRKITAIYLVSTRNKYWKFLAYDGNCFQSFNWSIVKTSICDVVWCTSINCVSIIRFFQYFWSLSPWFYSNGYDTNCVFKNWLFRHVTVSLERINFECLQNIILLVFHCT